MIESLRPESFQFLRANDTFRFSCQQCGECCFDQAVELDPFDLYRMTRARAWPDAETSSALWRLGHVTCDRAPGSGLRCLLAMPFWQRGRKCRFLDSELNEDGGLVRWSCRLHSLNAKPLVCSLSPLAQARDEDGFRLVPPVRDCPGIGKGAEQVVSDAIVPLSERLALRQFFVGNVRHRLTDRDRFMRAFDFDTVGTVSSLKALRQHLESL